jgi:hypothetical protein
VLTVYDSGGTNGRARDNTTIATHAINSSLKHILPAEEVDEFDAHVAATSGTVHGFNVDDVASAAGLAAEIVDRTTADALKANLLATVNAKTADYTLVAGDSGEIITMTVAGANTLTIPTGLPAGFTGMLVQLGAGQTTIAASGTTLRATPGLKLRAQYSAATYVHLGSEVYLITGDLSA